MSPWGHHAVGLTVGLTGAWVLSLGQLGAAVTELASTFSEAMVGVWNGDLTGSLSALTESSAFLGGAVVGGRAPDKLEIARWGRWTNRRYSLIPHRTLTHWWPVWMGLLIYSVLLVSQADDFTQTATSWGLLGFAISGVLHLALDVMTPTGVPILNPFGKKFSFSVYRAGSPAELLLISGVGLVCYVVATVAS